MEKIVADCDEDIVDSRTSQLKRPLKELIHILKNDTAKIITFSSEEMQVKHYNIRLAIDYRHTNKSTHRKRSFMA